MSASLLCFLLALGAAQAPSASRNGDAAPPADAPAVARSTEPRGLDALRADLAAADAASDRHDIAAASTLFDRALAHPLFRALPEEERLEAQKNASWVDYLAGRYPRAMARARAAAAIREDDRDNAYHIMLIHLADKRPAQAADAMLDLLRRWPSLGQSIRPERFYDILDGLDDQPARKLAYLQGLWDAGWDDTEHNASPMWMALVDLRLARGELAEAKRTLDRVDGVYAMIGLRADRRYDAIVDRASPRFDVAASAQRAVEALEAKARARPANLAVRAQLTYALLDAGRLDRVIEVVDEALGQDDTGRLKRTKYEDADEMEWLLNNRAMARFRLGQTDLAIADMRRASAWRSGKTVNVGTGLNLGALHCALGRADDALAAVDAVPEAEMSDYGRAVRAVQRLCAGILRNDAALQAQAMDFLKAHRRDLADSYFDALVMLGRLDEAAALLIAQLRDPDLRGYRLAQAQDTLHAPEFDGNRRWRANRDALFARPDVRAALERVGRIERYDVYVGIGFD